MQAAAAPSVMSDGDREILTRFAVAQASPYREVLRARVLLLAADGVANDRIAEQMRVSPATVRAWRTRFVTDGVAKFGKVASGRGRKATIEQRKIDEIIELTTKSRPDGETHWS